MTRNDHDDLALTDWELMQLAAIHQTLAGSDPELVARLDDNDSMVSFAGRPRRDQPGTDHRQAAPRGREQEARPGNVSGVPKADMRHRRRTSSEQEGSAVGDARLLSFALFACVALFWVTLVSAVFSARSRPAVAAALAAGVAVAWWLCLRLARAIIDEPRPSGARKV